MSRRFRNAFLGTLSVVLLFVACKDDAGPAASSRPDFFSEMVRVSEGFEAEVLETLEVGQYSYCRVLPLGHAAERWIVALQSPPAAERIHVRTFGQLAPFYSKRLERTFATLDFAVISTASTGKKK